MCISKLYLTTVLVCVRTLCVTCAFMDYWITLRCELLLLHILDIILILMGTENIYVYV